MYSTYMAATSYVVGSKAGPAYIEVPFIRCLACCKSRNEFIQAKLNCLSINYSDAPFWDHLVLAAKLQSILLSSLWLCQKRVLGAAQPRLVGGRAPSCPAGDPDCQLLGQASGLQCYSRFILLCPHAAACSRAASTLASRKLIIPGRGFCSAPSILGGPAGSRGVYTAFISCTISATLATRNTMLAAHNGKWTGRPYAHKRAWQQGQQRQV